MVKVSSALFSAVYGLMTLLVAVGLGWFILAKADYAYGIWHDHAGIKEAIEQYGPENRYRSGFAETTRTQRVELFSQISESVHNKGVGLRSIFYTVPGGNIVTPLLHEAEIIHLQDVGRLIHFLTMVLYFIVSAWLGITVFQLWRGKNLPAIKAQVSGFVVIVVACFLVLLLVGWEKVFNQLHIWVFPDDHQWFFYYQDSLMSTMMWAPHLFEYIGIAWFILASLFFAGLLLALKWLQGEKFNERSKRPKP